MSLLTCKLPHALDGRLAELARRRGVRKSVLVREAVAARIAEEAAAPRRRPANLIDALSGLHFAGQGVLELDRTAYGSQYGSGKLFRFLAPHLVNDHIQLHVNIHAERRPKALSIDNRTPTLLPCHD
jgi:predicted transcriptional regulator